MQQFHTQEYPTANRNYKDRLFRFVFKNKKDLLDLYNAINGTDYDNPEELEVNTLENVLYLSMKNDLSFLIDAELNLYEHQSTYNPNMPMRGLLYFAGVYNRHISDLFRRPTGEKEPCLECQTLMLNINYGHNRELMKKCRRLEEYAIFVDTIRKNQAKGQDLQGAVEAAVESCIAGGVLADILRAQKAEVVQMVLEGFDQEAYEKAVRQEGYDYGICQLITSLQEFSISRGDVLKKLQEKYELSEEEAEKYMKKYW